MPPPKSLVAFGVSNNTASRVYYIFEKGNEYHIKEHAWYVNRWIISDLTEVTNNVNRPAQNTNLAVFAAGDNPRIYYRGEKDDNVKELAWNPSTVRWESNDLTAQTGTTTPAAPGSKIVAFAINNNPRVYYPGRDLNVKEFAWNPSTIRWESNDLTARTNSTKLPESNFELTAYAVGEGPRVYYGTKDDHLQELAWTGSPPQWIGNDLGPIYEQ